VYLINRVPSTVLGRKSSHELLYDKLPKLHDLRVFGSLCFASTIGRTNPSLIPKKMCLLWIQKWHQRLYNFEYQ